MAARRHPVDVAAQRVDLAVVADHPVGVRQPPGRERVGRKPLVNEGQRGDHPLVLEVEVKFADLMGEQHPLVDDGARREGRHVEVFAGLAQAVDQMLGQFADHEQLAFEGIPVGAVVAATDEDLAHERFGRQHALAQSGIVDRHVAPAEDVLAFGFDKLLDHPDAGRPRPFGLGHEHHADGVFARFRKRDSDIAAHRAQMGVGHLDENARAVAGQRVGADRAAMRQVLENLQTLVDDPVALAVLDVHDAADPARIVFVARVVEPLLPGQPFVCAGCGIDHVRLCRSSFVPVWPSRSSSVGIVGPVGSGSSCGLGLCLPDSKVRNAGGPVACGRTSKSRFACFPPLTALPTSPQVRQRQQWEDRFKGFLRSGKQRAISVTRPPGRPGNRLHLGRSGMRLTADRAVRLSGPGGQRYGGAAGRYGAPSGQERTCNGSAPGDRCPHARCARMERRTPVPLPRLVLFPEDPDRPQPEGRRLAGASDRPAGGRESERTLSRHQSARAGPDAGHRRRSPYREQRYRLADRPAVSRAAADPRRPRGGNGRPAAPRGRPASRFEDDHLSIHPAAAPRAEIGGRAGRLPARAVPARSRETATPTRLSRSRSGSALRATGSPTRSSGPRRRGFATRSKTWTAGWAPPPTSWAGN